MQATHTHKRSGRRRSWLTLVGTLTLLITVFIFFGWAWSPAQAAGARLGQRLTELLAAGHLINTPAAPAKAAPRAVTAAAPLAGATLTVNSTADTDNNADTLLTLREAILISNGTRAVGAGEAAQVSGTPGWIISSSISAQAHRPSL